jgi:hypothetical protein
MFVRTIVLTACWLALPSAHAAAQQAPAKLDFPVGEAPTGIVPGQAPAASAAPGATAQPATAPAPSAPESAAKPAPTSATAPQPAAALSDMTAPTVPPPAEPPSTAPAPPSHYHELSDDPLFLPGALAIGGGSAVLLASLFTGLSAHGAYTQLEHDCKNDLCPSGSQGRIDNGKALAVVSTVMTGIGIVGVGVGAVLIIIANNRSGSASEVTAETAHLRLSPGPTPFSLAATASF